MAAHDPSEVVVVAHPPERRRQQMGAPAQAGQCCCCCCCCCLHTVGGLVGAAVAPAVGRSRARDRRRNQEEDDYGEAAWNIPERRDRTTRDGLSAVAVYWLSLLVLTFLFLGGAGVMALTGDTGVILGGVVLLALGLPVLQLVAAVPTAIYLGVSSRVDRRYEFGQLGKILAGTVLGTLLGIAVMVGIWVLLRGL